MLAIGIRYLNGFVAATEPDSRDCVEWPPHPGRVFMALAAAYFETGENPAERDALLWLEGLGAPEINAGPIETRALVTHFVPVNDRAGPSKALLQSAPLTRKRQPRTFARGWLERDTVFLTWRDALPSGPVREALRALCEKVTRIGHSTSLVHVWLASPSEVGEANWVPDEDHSERRFRVAVPGTLTELERAFNQRATAEYAALRVQAEDDFDKKAQRDAKKRLKANFKKPPTPHRPRLSLDRGYARRSAIEADPVVPGTVFTASFSVFRLEPEDAPVRHLDLACAAAIAKRWREALLVGCDMLPLSVRSLLSGHTADRAPLEGPHVAFLPLASVGHEHGDGHLLGMGVALPEGLARDIRRAMLAQLGGVRELLLGRLGKWGVTPETSASPPWNLRPETWTAHPRGATKWATVTPVVYDRHPKSRVPATAREEVAEMIREGCTRAGLPAPREVIVTHVSAHLGVPLAQEFPGFPRKDGSTRRHTHAILVFDAPVRGPILIGAGRYRGYGFFRPLRDSRTEGVG